ncbi:hypothetical protein ACE1CD_07000 [Aerosakkonema sp. BLCC-F183]|uniref:hypothetical protein n=1 Tax=Aerosakkonema sp. BLCC-F183 TaxID=3342834 RepID=UPI0035B86DD2
MISHLYLNPILANCNFDKSPTLPIVGFEIFIFAGVAAAFIILSKITDKLPLRFLIMSAGVMMFELFTAPMWHNYRMGWWAYVYHDVSWILTIGWSALILGVVLLVDKLLPDWKEWKKFVIYLIILTLAVIVLETIVVNIGLRSYAPEVIDATSGIWVAGVPLEILYYVPVFMALVICFYKYWSFVIDDIPLIPVKRRKWVRSFFLACMGIFLFEVMIEPMVSNEKFPKWSYIFHDISFIQTGMWILIVGFAAAVIGKFFLHYPTPQRFVIAVIITTAIAWPIESWLMQNNYRVYNHSTVETWLGYKTPILNTPVELAFAIPIYMTLIIVFIRYWETIIDNRL